jgi:hypothetical protein
VVYMARTVSRGTDHCRQLWLGVGHNSHPQLSAPRHNQGHIPHVLQEWHRWAW